jgi:hypothetical protein
MGPALPEKYQSLPPFSELYVFYADFVQLETFGYFHLVYYLPFFSPNQNTIN